MKNAGTSGRRQKRRVGSGAIKQLDKSNMLALLLDFPLQCSVAKDLSAKAVIPFDSRGFSRVAFAGLGGSAIGADLVRSYSYFESRIPLTVYREYDLPACVDSSTLMFISSYSGNTEETLSAYVQAREKKAPLIAISAGGVLRDMARRDGIPFIEIPGGLPPRCALGYLCLIPLGILARLGIIREVEVSVHRMVKLLEELKNNNLNPRVGQKDNIARHIAAKLYNKFTVVYSSSIHFDAVATRLRAQLSENAKALASSHVFPEMNHNEIMGWQHPKRLFKDFVVLMLRYSGMHPRVAKRMDITRDIIKGEGAEVIEIWSRGEDLLSNMFSLIYIGDFISYYLAILYGIDPTPVERVTYVKNQLAKGT